MKLLLAIDGSPYSHNAIEELANRTFPPGTELRILSAFTPSSLVMKTRLSMAGDAEYYAELDAEAKKSALNAIDEAVKIIEERNPELKISKIVKRGSAKESILEEAEQFGADKIIVGSQGKGAVSRFLLGSVSQAIAMHAPCSVEIIRKKKD